MPRHHHRDHASAGPSQRQLRVGELIRHALAEMLSRGEIHDPVIEAHMITVPEVAMTADLRLATIYVMPLGGRDAKPVLEALERNKKFLRGEIARRVNLKFAPDIRFRFDERFDEAERIEKILRTPRGPARSRIRSRRRGRNERAESASQSGAAGGGAEAAQAREARRARLDHSRQAGRHDVDARGRGDQAPVHGQARRPCRHARSARLRPPAARARRGDQDGSVRDGRAQALPLHGALGRGARHRRRRGQGGRHQPRRGPTPEAIDACLPAFTGTIAQVPPKFSAIKIEGERAYDLARDGQEVVLEARPVDIHGLALVDTPDADTAVFEAECGKGTYVRALARDIGRVLGCLGHVSALRRTRSARSTKTT